MHGRTFSLALLVAVTMAMMPACGQASAGMGQADGGATKTQAASTDGGPAPLSSAADAGSAPPSDEASPPSSSEDLSARARHLLEAIAQDNAQLAADMELPRDAYVACRDTTETTRAWEKGVNGPFTRQIHGLHKRLKNMERAQFTSIELGRSLSQVVPRKKEWKKPLWKVRHSHMTFTSEGKTQRIEIAEMMGWRGAWYITRLH